MFKPLALTFSLLTFCQLSWADSCPSIHDLKAHTLSGWKAYDSDDGSPLSTARATQFENSAEQFALAEWKDTHHQTGTIHCYYRDHNGSDLEAYLAKDNFSPENPKNYWYQVSGFWQCAAGGNQCLFEKKSLSPTELAKK